MTLHIERIDYVNMPPSWDEFVKSLLRGIDTLTGLCQQRRWLQASLARRSQLRELCSA